MHKIMYSLHVASNVCKEEGKDQESMQFTYVVICHSLLMLV